MPYLRSKFGAALCVAGALGVGGLAWWNATRLTAENDPVGYSIEIAQRAMRGLAMIPIDDIGAIGEGLSAAPVDGVVDLQEDRLEAVLDDLRGYVAEIIRTRFGEAGPDAYIDLQRRRGRRFLTAQEFPTSPGASLDAISSYWLGKPASPGVTPEDLFRALWSVSLDGSNGSNRAVGVAVSAGGMAIALGRVEHPDMPHTEELDGRLGAETWYGSVSHTCGRWMVPPNSKGSLIERHGPLVSASVGVVLDFLGGPRRPIVFLFFWDPELGAWQIDAVTINNYDPPAGVNPCPVF